MQQQLILLCFSIISIPLLYSKMGAVQSEESTSFLPNNYEILRVQKDLKILQQRKSGSQFALLQQTFVNKQAYDSHFKRTREKQNSMRESENILKMVKLWSKEHNGVCSNLFKIYTVHEYPKVRLINEIEARRAEQKYFEEAEILSILQSFLNAFMTEPSYSNISPHLIFIFPEGILKVINIELMDPHYQCIFNSQYYYSPEKMKNFQSVNLSKQENQKESVFSMGMTLLHAALLDDVSTCYEISLKRFNRKKLDHLTQRLGKKYSEALCNLINSMLVFDHQTRIGMDQLQRAVDQLSSEPMTINSFVDNDQLSSEQHLQPLSSISLNAIQKPRKALVESSQTNFNTSSLTMSNFVNPIRKSEFQIIVDPLNGNSASKRLSHPNQNIQDKQNIFTDGRIMTMIKQGIQKIDKTSKERSVMKQMKSSDKKPIISSKDLFSQYQLNTNNKPLQSEYTVQQYQDQSRYEGRIEKGMKNGFGKLIYPDGVFYQGSFKDDTLCGRGALYYGPNRPAYIGDWQDNKFNGQGTLYNEYSTLIETPFDYSDFNKIGDQWIKFSGTFKQDIKEGNGRIILTNGETIEAFFSGGVINGQGVFTDLHGRRIKGKWIGNKLQVLSQ